MKRALVVLAHANPESLCASLAKSYIEGFRAGGGEVELLSLAELSFDPVFRGPEQELEPGLRGAQAAILRADHLVFVFPTYWGLPPGILKAFIDRVMLPGFAYLHEGKALPTGLLKGRTARVVATMDSPSWWYSLAHHRAIHATLGTATLSYVGIKRTQFSVLYSVEKKSRDELSQLVHALGQAARRDAGDKSGRRAALEPARPRLT